MAKFSRDSRYTHYATAYSTVDAAGRRVAAVTPATIPDQSELGEHVLRQHERLDHLANYYLQSPTAYWRIAHHNSLLVPDAAYAHQTLHIPRKD